MATKKRAKELAAKKAGNKKAAYPIPNTKCVDCSRPICRSDIYIVRNSVWAEAGMDGWNSGWLHLRCLEKRLGRTLIRGDDLLTWHVRGEKFAADPDYLKSPEYLEHVSKKK